MQKCDAWTVGMRVLLPCEKIPYAERCGTVLEVIGENDCVIRYDAGEGSSPDGIRQDMDGIDPLRDSTPDAREEKPKYHRKPDECSHEFLNLMREICTSCGSTFQELQQRRPKPDPYAKCREADAAPLENAEAALEHLTGALIDAQWAITGRVIYRDYDVNKLSSLREWAAQMRPLLAEIEKLLRRIDG